SILASIRKRDNLHKLYKNNPYNYYYRVKFTKYRNTLVTVIKKSKERHAFNLLNNNSGNIKKQYEILSDFLNIPTKHSSNIDIKQFDSETETEIAEKFNDHFVSIGEQTVNTISDDILFEPYDYNVANKFVFVNITVDKVKRYIKGMKNNKASGS